MAAPSIDENDEKPLDPAIERVRRKLLRFVAINLSLLFAAVMAVVAAVVYKSATSETPAPSAAGAAIGVPAGETLAGEIPVPAGARIVSHGLSGSRISLDIELPSQERQIVVYDMAERRVVALIKVTSQ